MATHAIATNDATDIRSAITVFLHDRLQPKLDGLKEGDDEARSKLIAEHQPAVWIADAARRVGQIQQVTHAIKFTHPSADGSSLSCSGNPAAGAQELGTHILGEGAAADVVGNAAALDVYKFLRITVDGRSLLSRAIARDPGLAEAISDEPVEAAGWMAAFANLPEAKGSPASHKLAKQIYWPVGNGGYHLLAPLFSSCLAQSVHERINDDIFSEAAKAAKEAWRKRENYGRSHRYYPNLIMQKFGGDNPQNISALTVKRRAENKKQGDNYLLASVPPIWESPLIRPPPKTDTVFARYFERRKEVRRLTDVLKTFLRRVADAGSNVRIRETRADLVADLCGEALHMAAELRHALTPGWTAEAGCQLSLAEQCWLDPERSLGDADFAIHYRRGDWKDEVCLRFANWLNARLQSDKTHFGGPEAQAWQTALSSELKLLREELDDE